MIRIQLVDIDEPCTHDTVFGGLCANCGQEMDKYAIMSTIAENDMLI